MISKIKKELQNNKRDNKGAALVMVIVAIAFIGMLVAMIIYMAYCNYLMKSNDRLAKDNFYSAEYALDVINAGLQMDVSKSMSEAYVNAMQGSTGKSAEEMESVFQSEYKKNLIKALQEGSNANKWDAEHLKQFWTDNGMDVASTAGLKGAHLSADGDQLLEALDNKDYITLHNLKVVYTDERGFVSVIKTDIRIKIPTVGFAQAATRMSIEQFSLIANDSLVNDNLVTTSAGINQGSSVRISGNVFGGYDGVVVGNQAKTEFAINETDQATGGDYTYNLIAESITVDNSNGSAGLDVDETFDSYVNDINVQSSRLEMAGDMYVGDDLDIGGSGSDVTLSGKYRGYGNMIGSADSSSSILINGGDTALDFSGLQELVLSGHAYVGAKKYDADLDRLAYGTGENANAITSDKIEDMEDMDEYTERLSEDGSPYKDENAQPADPQNVIIPRNNSDLMMGESISVKANQLLYMVPTECIGFNRKTNAQVIAKNPMTYAEYEMLLEEEEIENPDGTTTKEMIYDPVRLDNLWTKLGGVTYTSDYKAVYRRVNGSVLVYLYLDFGANEMMANEFFKAYYEYDKEGIDRYVNSYIREMRWSTALTADNASMLTLAGNAFYLSRADEVIFQENDLLDSEKYLNMMSWQVDYSKQQEAMMHSLSPNYDEMTSEQQSSEIFNSLVDEEKLAQMSGKDFALPIAGGAVNLYATIVDGDVVYPSTDCPSNSRMIVASGDIYITSNFKGLAIAGGNIYVCDGCSKIDYSPADVLQVMRAKVTEGGTDIYAYEVFGASGELSYAGAAEGEETEEEKIDLSDLILYQDWKKE